MKAFFNAWIAAAVALPLVLLPMVRAFHRNPELFGLNIKPQTATAAQSKKQAIPPRDELLTRAAACQYSEDITKVDDKTLNDVVAKCEAKK